MTQFWTAVTLVLCGAVATFMRRPWAQWIAALFQIAGLIVLATVVTNDWLKVTALIFAGAVLASGITSEVDYRKRKKEERNAQ